MNGQLFNTAPVYDKHIVSIINMMLKRLKNNNPKPDSKVYVRNANFIKDIYDGNFLKNKFNTERKDYDYSGTFEKISLCKNNWQNVRNCVNDCLNNVELAKDKSRLPFNKKFIDSISFATFFQFYDITNSNNGINSHFVNLLNPPLMSYEYTSSLTIEKLKKECLGSLVKEGDIICNKYFSDIKQRLSFWYNILDFSRWLKNMKSAFHSEYDEFIMLCEDGNPLTDFLKYLKTSLSYKQGQNIIMLPVYFQLSRVGSNKLEYQFLGWLKNGIEKNRFSVLKNLPKSIEHYYSDESFEKRKQEIVTPKKKEIVDADDLPVF